MQNPWNYFSLHLYLNLIIYLVYLMIQSMILLPPKLPVKNYFLSERKPAEQMGHLLVCSTAFTSTKVLLFHWVRVIKKKSFLFIQQVCLPSSISSHGTKSLRTDRDIRAEWFLYSLRFSFTQFLHAAFAPQSTQKPHPFQTSLTLDAAMLMITTVDGENSQTLGKKRMETHGINQSQDEISAQERLLSRLLFLSKY